jgi:hypothetical protein
MRSGGPNALPAQWHDSPRASPPGARPQVPSAFFFEHWHRHRTEGLARPLGGLPCRTTPLSAVSTAHVRLRARFATITASMNSSTILLGELETLAVELVQRRWAARAGLVSDEGVVLSLCSARTPGERGSFALGAPETPESNDIVARMLVEALDEHIWIYVDFGSLRLVARLARAGYAGAATAWLAGDLRRLGVTVERETLARD